MIRILAVDDHHLFRGGIVALVGHQSDMNIVGEASNGHEAIQQFRALRRPRTGMVDQPDWRLAG